VDYTMNMAWYQQLLNFGGTHDESMGATFSHHASPWFLLWNPPGPAS